MRTPCALTIVLFAFGPAAGCGGNTSQNEADAGGRSVTTATGAGGSTTSGAGGSTTSGAGGSGQGPRPSAALSFYLTTASTAANARCTPGAHWVNIPFAPMGGPRTTRDSRADVAVDGADGMGVKCSVKDGGGGLFEVSAELRSPAADPMGFPVNPTVVTVGTSIARGAVGAGAVSILDSKTASTYSSDACSFSVQNQLPNSLDIAPGRVWASVTCPTFRDPASPDMDAVCQISQGYFTLENCDQ